MNLVDRKSGKKKFLLWRLILCWSRPNWIPNPAPNLGPALFSQSHGPENEVAIWWQLNSEIYSQNEWLFWPSLWYCTISWHGCREISVWHVKMPTMSSIRSPIWGLYWTEKCLLDSHPVFMKIIGHVGHFRWLGPNVWWEISQILIEYIKPIRQMSDEQWKFFGYTAHLPFFFLF